MARRLRGDGHADTLSVLRLIKRLAVLSLFLLASIVFYWEIVLPGRILAEYDIWTYFYPLRSYAAEAIRAGRFPLWNPDIFLGAPFFANPQTSLLYPGTILFYVLPVAYAYSLSVILHVLLAAVFMYALLRGTFGVGAAAAIVGASAFAFGGFASAQVGHINQLSASAWLPAIALAADTALRHRSIRWTVAAGGALGVQLLAGHAQESYMTLWVLAVLLGWRAITGTQVPEPTNPASAERRAADRTQSFVKRIGRDGSIAAVVSVSLGLLAFGIAAVQLIPTFELSNESIRGGGMSFADATSFSLIPPMLLRSLLPGYWYNVFSEYMGYIGAVSLGFVGIALAFGSLRTTLCAAALTLLGLFFAVGIANPLYPLAFDYIPGMDLFRVPARWLFVYTFGAATLSAIGVDWVLNRSQEPVRPVRVLLVGAVVAGLLVLAVPLVPTAPGRIWALWIGGFAAALALAIVALRWPRPAVATAIVAAVLSELRFAAIDLPQRHAVPVAVIEETRPVAAYLRRTDQGGRILSIARTEYELSDADEVSRRFGDLGPAGNFALNSGIKLDEVMSPNVPLRYGLSTVDGYDGGVLPLRRYLSIASLLVPSSEIRADGVLRTRLIAIPDAPLLELFNIRRVVANEVTDVDLDGLRYDVATARTLEAGAHVRVDLPAPTGVKAVGLLSSVTSDPGTEHELGEMTMLRSDGTREAQPLNYGDAIYHEMGPGPMSADQPTAGLSRGGRKDTAVRLPVLEGAPITAIEWTWFGPGKWNLRASSLETVEGNQIQLMLQPGLQKVEFSPIKVYERVSEATRWSPTIRLATRADDLDDEAALAMLRAAPDGRQHIALQDTVGAGDRSPEPGAAFRRIDETPERLMFHRIDPDGDGYLLVDDAWFPGWRAEVDGRSVPVYRANVHFKAVWVPSSAQTVTLIYEPSSVRVGAMISVAAILIAAVLLVVGGARRRTSPA